MDINGRNNGDFTASHTNTNRDRFDPPVSPYSSRPSSITQSGDQQTAYLGPNTPLPQENKGLLTTSHSNPSRGPRHYRHWNYSLSNWNWELSTWLLGSLAFATIIVLLLVYENDRLDSWKSEIQITTIIAALSAVAQSALLVSLSAGLGQLKWTWIRDSRSATDLETFDDASRGPYGSAKLIVLGLWSGERALGGGQSKTGRFSKFPRLAALGALAVILLLAFSTFVQQSLAIVLRQYKLNDLQPSIAATTLYEQRDGTTLLAQSGIAGDVYINDAVTSGLLSRINTPSDVSGDCGAERCDWEPYWTLAVCSTVEDVSSDITSLRPMTVRDVPMLGPNVSTTRYNTLAMVADPSYREMIILPGGTGRNNMTIEKRGTISDALVFYYPPCTPDWYNSFTEQSNWRAYRTKLSLCLQRLNSSFYNSSMHTTVLESKTDVAWTATPIENSGTTNICGNSSDASHCVTDLYISSWAVMLNETLTGTASTAPGGDKAYDTDAIRTFVADCQGPDPETCSNDTNIGFPNFESRMLNIASAMSNTIRNAPSANRVVGTAKATAQFIQVDARWLTFPAAVWLMATVFLFATIWHSRANDAPLWKSSTLALLACQDPNNDLRSEREVTKALRATALQLKEDEGGWQLVQGQNRRQ